MGFLAWLESDSANYVSIAMVCVCAGLTLQNGFMHLMNYSRDDLQRHITRIILVIPIYCTTSWLEMEYPDTETVCHAVVDFWEALVIYSFFNLILEYVGGEHNWLLCVQQSHPDGLHHIPPFRWCFPRAMNLNPGWLRGCKVACFQFVFIKPFFGLLMLPVLFTGNYDVEPWPWIRTIVYNITYTLAMYALALLYLTTHDHPSLKPKRPLAKFSTVKIVIFFTYWQQYLLVFFNLSATDLDNTLAFLTMVEMTLCAIPFNWIAFPWREFQTGLMDTSVVETGAGAIELVESGNGSPSDKLKSQFNKFNLAMNHVATNAKKVFSPNDMVDSANQNFTNKYKTHVLLESSQEYVIEDNPLAANSPDNKKKKRTFRARTYLIGEKAGGQNDLSPVKEHDTSPAMIIGEPLADSPTPPSPTKAPLLAAATVVPLLPMPAKHKATSAYTRLEEEPEKEEHEETHSPK